MRTAFALIALAFFLLATPAPLPAQEIKTSVDPPSKKAERPAPSEKPSFTFRKRRLQMDADARLADDCRAHQAPPALSRVSRANRVLRARPP